MVVIDVILEAHHRSGYAFGVVDSGDDPTVLLFRGKALCQDVDSRRKKVILRLWRHNEAIRLFAIGLGPDDEAIAKMGRIDQWESIRPRIGREERLRTEINRAPGGNI